MTALYKRIASCIVAMDNCRKSNNREWLLKHEAVARALVKQYMPSGSGLDVGTSIDLGSIRGDRIIFDTSFHHMNDTGHYDGWTDHTVVVTPDLVFDFALRITGRDRNDIKDYLGELYDGALRQDISDDDYMKLVAGVS